MVLSEQPVERNNTIIALMWIYVLPSWILFGKLLSETDSASVNLLIPVIPYSALFLLFLKSNEKTRKDWILVIFAGAAANLPQLFVLYLLYNWLVSGFAA